MSQKQRRGSGNREQKWQPKTKPNPVTSASASVDEAVTSKLGGLSISDGQVWKPKSYGTVAGSNAASAADVQTEKNNVDLSRIFLKPNLLENFKVDNSTYSLAQIRATFYPKFENEKSDQEIRIRMIEMVSKGLATLEVSLKHSGSLFMYAGNEGGAYAKNSFGNIYTAVGVFVLGRMFHEAWGSKAGEKQAQFNDFIERNRICISMELVTAVLGDHGQRPREDYAVVTAVTELGNGKPKFYSTPEVIAFCRKWRLPTNHVWLFSTRKSVTSFFAAYDLLCEEGTATSVCRALDEVADISAPGSKDHITVQGEILEGLVARIVSHESSKHMEEVLKDHPPPSADGAGMDLGPSLREICAANRLDEKQQIKALLQKVGSSFCPDHSDWCDSHSRNADRSVLTKFLQAHPADYSTAKLQANKERAAGIAKNNNDIVGHVNNGSSTSTIDGLANEDANLMIKLKFLTYKLRTFLIRNGLSILFKDGPAAYRAYYLRRHWFLVLDGNRAQMLRISLSQSRSPMQMKIWGTSAGKQRELSKMLDECLNSRAVYIRRKCGNRQLSSAIYLSEAEPFLEQYAKRSPENQALIGSAGNLVKTEDFLAVVEGGMDEEGDLATEREEAPASLSPSVKDTIQKTEGLIVFFPGIPGCAKSALCKELLNTPGGLGDDRPVQSLMGDLIKGRYWPKIADECRKKPYSIILADKNAPNEEVWKQIENMCHSTRASAVPVIPDSEGTDSNPFALDALAVFMFRVLQRDNHPGNLDKLSPNAGYVMLMFYHLYDGKSRKYFEDELVERFGSLVKIPLLKPDR
ncbi:hypothetical protein GOBAR_AA39324 [Gossypium barbadense]|uniref:tRNA ligase phosphodiesterase domain-containing protein n=1 Tax=Gossypium barbadense TaxID=3634 RepID=A0A2P5VRF4_GOSBA|nr:hypothetical protein GOBAR_AA39324 [Gossypium barbadense]